MAKQISVADCWYFLLKVNSRAMAAAREWPLLVIFCAAMSVQSQGNALPTHAINVSQARAISREAYIYAVPMVENYNSIYQLAIEETGDQYKGPINQINNVPRVFGPKDTSVITPNADTPYSFLIMDLRSEPLVVTLPPVEAERYYSLQLVDLYGHNADYLGTRVDGNGGGNFLIAGPGWHGKPPAGIKRVVRSDTELMFSQFRTQLKNAGDLDNVKKIQSGYKVAPLSKFVGTPSPKPAAAIDYPKISRDRIDANFFAYVNFLLRFCTPYPDEQNLRDRFKAIGVAPGAPWPPKLPQPILAAIAQGQQDGQNAVQAAAKKTTSSLHVFGSHEALRGKYLERAVGARLGLYGNSAQEALYPAYQLNQAGQQLDSGRHDYRLTFPRGELPPVNAFWSITMYDGRTKFMVDNPLDRYLINSAMLSKLRRNADGSITLLLQHDSPGKDLEPNWLPAPDGPMYAVLRLYLPKPQVLSGKWKVPQLREVPRGTRSTAFSIK